MAGSVPDLPGIRAPSEGAREIMQDIQRLIDRRSRNFPGAQPVSFAKRHIEDLLSEDYFVCEKSDGLRCLMLLSEYDGEERVYLITRKCEVTMVEFLHVPLASPDTHHSGTLIDGELVYTRDKRLKYLMFDCLSFNGMPLTHRNLAKRLSYLQEKVYKPYHRLCREFPEDTSRFSFQLVMKLMQASYHLADVLEGQSRLTHVSDGLIFTKVDAPYTSGTTEDILKWKPDSENSVDFALRLDFGIYKDEEDEYIDYDSKPKIELLAWHGNIDLPYCELTLSSDEWEELKEREEPLNYRVVECTLDKENQWRLLRFRDDKEHGNNVRVVDNVIESIKDNVTEEKLISEVPKIRENWKQRAESNLKRQSDEHPSKRPRPS